MKNLKKSETEACILSVLYVISFGISCYLRSVAVFTVSTLFLVTLLACSWRIEQLEKRIVFYRRELSRQIREECESELGSEQEQSQIIMSKGKTA